MTNHRHDKSQIDQPYPVGGDKICVFYLFRIKMEVFTGVRRGVGCPSQFT